jgi:hypothetical protein
MQNNKILVVIGISIMQALVIIGAIALGFYMGQTLSSRDVPASGSAQVGIQPAGGPQQPGNQQGGAGNFSQPGGGGNQQGGGPGNPQAGGFGGQQGQVGNQGDQRPLPPGLDTPPDRIGHVTEVSAGAITIMSQQQPVTIQYTDQTECVDAQGASMECGTIAANQAIAVYGTADSTGQTFVATKIVVLPPRPDGAGGNQGAPQP